MSQQYDDNNEEIITQSTGDDIKECVKLEGERIPVEKQSRTVKDEAEDFIFLKPSRVREGVSSGDNGEVVIKRRRHHHKKKMKKWKKFLIAFGCVLLALVLIVTGVGTYLLINGSNQLKEVTTVIDIPEELGASYQGDYVVYKGEKYIYNDNMTTILCMGVDKRDIEDNTMTGANGQSDVVILGALDTSTGKMTLINISRDTMTDVSVYSVGGQYMETREMQLCLAYSYGRDPEMSCANELQAVQRIFYNLPIQSYIALDLDGIAAVNDAVDGVDVVSPETIGEFTEGESYHLVGDMAETFVRKRIMTTPEANNMRMKRQQTYMNAFMKKFVSKTKNNILSALDLYNASNGYTCTNLNPSKVTYLAQTVLSNGLDMEMVSAPGKSKMGEKHAEFYIDEEKFYEMFLSIYYKKI